jgi:hypothetical protein
MEGSPTGVQQGPRQPHLVESLQEEVVPGAASIDEDSVELDILDDGANCERIPPVEQSLPSSAREKWQWNKIKIDSDTKITDNHFSKKWRKKHKTRHSFISPS